MVKPIFVDNDTFGLYPTKLLLDKREKYKQNLRRSLNEWSSKLTGTERYYISLHLEIPIFKVKSLLSGNIGEFFAHEALAILCYLELNYAHLKD